MTRRALIRFGVLVSLTASAACSPTAPVPGPPLVPFEPHFAAGTSWSFVSGETGKAVVGAVVSLSGTGVTGAVERTYVTNSTGQITLDAILLQTPAPALDVVADGFLSRATTVELADGSAFTLWPSTSPTGLDEDFSAMAVYSSAHCPVRRDPRFLIRHSVATEVVTLVLEATVSSPEVVALHEAAVAAVNTVTEGQPRYVVGRTPPSSGVSLQVRVDPSRAACTLGLAGAFVSLQYPDGWIAGGEVVYCSDAYARSRRYVLHELGHTVGLQHSDGDLEDDLMSCYGTSTDFSNRERLAVHLMSQRPGRNLWPDRDRPTFTSALTSAEASTSTIVCPRRGGQ